jgi:hypothetical protein
MSNELNEGEQYLYIQTTGHNGVYAYPNKDRVKGKNHPHFKADGVAVWIRKKKPKQEYNAVEELLIKKDFED